jgi:5-formyltetrahydrofolate cyclo-ligase
MRIVTINTQTRKQALRQRIIAARDSLTASERLALSEIITANISLLDAYRDAKRVLGYMNFGTEFAAMLWATPSR